MLEWLHVDFIFSQEGLLEENEVILYYIADEYADSLEKVMGCLSIPRSYGPTPR